MNDINNHDIDMSLWESLLQLNKKNNKNEVFLMYINFIVKDLLSDYNEALDLILSELESMRSNFKIKKRCRTEFRKDIDAAKKSVINNKTKILKDINNTIENFLIELDNWKKHNEILLNIINVISDIIINNIKNFSVSFGDFWIIISNKSIFEKIKSIKIYHNFIFSKDTVYLLNEMNKNINSILKKEDIIWNNESQVLDNKSNKVLLNDSIENNSIEDKLNKNVKDIENIINSVRTWIFFFIRNYPYKFSIIYRRLEVAMQKLSEIEKLQDVNISQWKSIQKLEQMILDLKNIKQENISLKRQSDVDNYTISKQKLLIEDFESKINILEEKLKKISKIWNNKQSNILQDIDTDEIKKLEEDLLQSWQEIEKLNLEKTELNEEKIRLNNEVFNQISINTKLQLVLENMKKNKGKEVEAFMNNCEINFKDCTNDELLKYIFYWDWSEELKKETVLIIINFLNYFVWEVTKWASSSTNHNDWVWWWAYSNKFINPIINFIKQKQNNMSYDNFLEEIIYINWKKFIEQYFSENEYINTKQKIVKNVLALFLNDCKSALPIFKALRYLADKLAKLNSWNSDLSILVFNIQKVLDSQYVKNSINSKLINIAEKIKEEHK